MSFTVLMSVYYKDNPEYLELSIKSIWTDQILKPDKIVLIKDGVLTKNLEIVIERWEKLLKGILLIIENKENLGLTKSLNIGLKYVNTSYVARMDSDDISLPNRFIKQVDFLEMNPDISVVGCFLQEIDDNNMFTKVREYPVEHHVLKKYIFKATPLPHPAVMMRMSLFNDGITYNEKYITTQDLSLWVDILIKGYKIANIPEILFLFRMTKDTFSRRNRTKAYNEFKIYMRGIYKLKKYTFAYIYPICRLVFRLMPTWLIKYTYNSSVRKIL